MRTFGNNNPYSNAEVKKDLAKIASIKSRRGYTQKEDSSYSEIQEYATGQEIGETDWFAEDSRSDQLFPDEQGHETCAFLTSEFDDFLNHVDLVCLMDNALSNFRPVPFALDLTYNDDAKDFDKKFGWRCHSQNVNTTGFCTVKYFEDTDHFEPLLPKGRIKVMPRFVVGFDPELSEEITQERMTRTGWESLRREELSNKAKFCVLSELRAQSKQMLGWLEQHHQNKELEQMLANVTALNEFFDGAFKVAKDNDPHNLAAYANRDRVTQAILSHNIMQQ